MDYVDPDWIPVSKKIGGSRAETLTPMQVIKYAMEEFLLRSSNESLVGIPPNSDAMSNEVYVVLTNRFGLDSETLCTPAK